MLQPPIRFALTMVMVGDDFRELRDRLLDLSRDIDAMLYLHGAMAADEADQAVYNIVAGTFGDDKTLADRFVRLNFDVARRKDRQEVLVHPGLVDPDSIALCRDCLKQQIPTEVLCDAANGALAQEVPIFQRLLGLLNGAVRPEYQESTTV